MQAVANFVEGVLQSTGIGTGNTSMTVTLPTGVVAPTAPFYLVIWNSTAYASPAYDPTREIVLVNVASQVGTTLTVTSMTRGQDGTSANLHNTLGATYLCGQYITAALWDQLNAPLSQISANSLVGNNSASVADAGALSVAQVSAMLSGAASASNLIPMTNCAGAVGLNGQNLTNIGTLGAVTLVVNGVTATATPTANAIPKADASGTLNSWVSGQGPNVTLIGKSLGSGTSVTASVSAGVATVNHTAHGYSTGDVIVMAGGTSGGSIGDFNQLHVITGTATNSYTFNTTAATGSITGSPVETFWFKGSRCNNPTKISNVTRQGQGQYTFIFTNTQNDAWYGVNYSAGSSGTVTVASPMNPLASTTQVGCYVHDVSNAQQDATYLEAAFTGLI